MCLHNEKRPEYTWGQRQVMNKFSGALLITLFVLILRINPVFAGTQYSPAVPNTNQRETTASPMETEEKGMVEKVEYQLPYPGILPDHPLYFLKQIRDGILDRLIVDPLRKAEFYILQADKRLGMGMMLFDKGNATLGEQVVSKGEQYLNNTLVKLDEVKNSGREIPAAVVDRLEKSIAKHREVVGELLTKAQDAQRIGLESSFSVLDRLQGELGNLK